MRRPNHVVERVTDEPTTATGSREASQGTHRGAIASLGLEAFLQVPSGLLGSVKGLVDLEQCGVTVSEQQGQSTAEGSKSGTYRIWAHPV